MNDNRRSFLEDRQRGMGGTDIPGILQLYPKRNALDVYHEKTRPVREDDQASVDLLRGLSLEEMARDHYWAKTGRRGRNIRGVTTHPDYPAFNCHVDFEIFADSDREKEWTRGTGVGETKCPRAFVLRKVVDHGQRESELVQGLTYCAVSRRSWCGFNYFSLEWDDGTGSPTLPVDVQADPELGKQLLEIGQRFWDEHVVPRKPPNPADWKPIGQRVVEEVRESTGDLFTLVDAEAIELSREIAEARSLFKRTGTSVEELQDRMLAYVEAESPSDRVVCPEGHKHTIVRLAGRRTLQRDSIALHRAIDRDQMRSYLIGEGGRTELETSDQVDALIDSMELDLDRFMRVGEPSKHIRFTEGKG